MDVPLQLICFSQSNMATIRAGTGPFMDSVLSNLVTNAEVKGQGVCLCLSSILMW